MKTEITKQLIFFNEFKEIISVFGQMEIGSEEVDVDLLANYLVSHKFFVDTFDYNEPEEIDHYITGLIEDGFPVWRFLKTSDWTKNMIEKSFTEECKNELNEMEKMYKCLTCSYFECKETSIGIYERCLNKDCPESYYNNHGRALLKLHKKCKYYKKEEGNKI